MSTHPLRPPRLTGGTRPRRFETFPQKPTALWPGASSSSSLSYRLLLVKLANALAAWATTVVPYMSVRPAFVQIAQRRLARLLSLQSVRISKKAVRVLLYVARLHHLLCRRRHQQLQLGLAYIKFKAVALLPRVVA